MSIKILGGIAKSHPLKVPTSEITRPTSVILRRKIFDSKQNWSEKIFIDACAGSGAMGLEAWSRGASQVYFIESHRRAFEVLKANISLLKNKFAEDSQKRPMQSFCTSFQKYCESKSLSSFNSHTTIFLDPPYEKHEVYLDILNSISKLSIPSLELWIESDTHKGPSFEDLNIGRFGFSLEKHMKQGSHFLGVFGKDVL